MLRITPITHFASGAEFRCVLFPRAGTPPKHIGVRFGLLVRIATEDARCDLTDLSRGAVAIEAPRGPRTTVAEAQGSA